MKVIKPLILLFILSLSSICAAQKTSKNVFEFRVEAGMINDLKSEKEYVSSAIPDGRFIVENRHFAKSRNYGISYSRFINPNFGLKLLIGKTTFGFDYKGIDEGLAGTTAPLRGSLRTTHAELGFSLIGKIPLTPFINLLLEPSLRLHTEEETIQNSIIIYHTNSSSFTFYSGIEIPMFGDHFYINTGFLLKVPLKNYAFFGATYPEYYPYLIGIKLGVNYQF